MEQRVNVTYSKALVRHAAGCFWWRSTGWKLLLASLVTALALVLQFRSGSYTWITVVCAAALALAVVFTVMLYVVHYRRGIGRLAAMGSPEATLEASERALMITSGAGSASIGWSDVRCIWRFRRVWLLFLSPSTFMTLPVEQIPGHFLEFVSQRVQASGGRMR